MNVYAPLFLMVAFLWPSDAASAHVPFEGAGGFYGGVLHPLFVPAHVLAILGTGLLIGQQVPRWPWPAAACYGVGLVAGFAAIVSAVVPQLANEVLLATTAVGGALVALAWPIPKFLVSTLAFVTGLALALDSPPHVTFVQDASVILLGTFCGAIILLLVVLEGAIALNREWQRLGARIVGSWIAASAIMVLALALRLAR
jgi:urease accessory protein